MTGILRSTIAITGLGLAVAAMPAIAFAAVQPGSGDERANIQQGPEFVRLAQNRAVEMYIDSQGREIYVDPDTGDIIAVRRPSQMRQRVSPDLEILGRVPRSGDYRNDQYDREERRREREVELGRREPGPDYAPSYDDRRVYREEFPEQPVLRQPEPRAPAPESREPGSIVRVPLDAPDDDVAAYPDELPSDDQLPAAQPPVMDSPPAVVWDGASDDVTRIQVLLDRRGVSPGVIDGRMGDNVNKALDAYKDKFGSALRTYDKESIATGLEESGGDAFSQYTITPADVAGPYVASVPDDYGEKAKLERLGFTTTSEMLAERFHMDEKYLKAINPGIEFDRPGTIIKVINTGAAIDEKVVRIVADKDRKQVRAYGASGALVAAYPATIGSQDTPSPSGTVTVERIAFDPEYTYNPDVNFKQGENHEVLTIPPGPNGPVGSIWIALSKPTYGIHGTPEPSKIGKTYSHGCVRLTNWDAQELAKIVEKGVTVEFL